MHWVKSADFFLWKTGHKIAALLGYDANLKKWRKLSCFDDENSESEHEKEAYMTMWVTI